MSSTTPLKESTFAVNNRKDAHFNPTYALSKGNVNLRQINLLLQMLKKTQKLHIFPKVLNISTADLKSSSECITKDLQKKRDAFFTTICVLNTSTAD